MNETKVLDILKAFVRLQEWPNEFTVEEIKDLLDDASSVIYEIETR